MNKRRVDALTREQTTGRRSGSDPDHGLAERAAALHVGQGIPEVKVNRLLLNNTDVRGVGWGAYAMTRPGYMQEQWAELVPMMESGTVKPPIGATYDLADFGAALAEMEDRRTLGKSVVRVRP